MTLTERNVAFAEAYYRGMADKDLSAVAERLHSNVRFSSPVAEVTGKEKVIEAAKRFTTLLKSLKIRAKFGSEEQAMLVDDADFGQPIGVCRTAVLMTFQDGLIARVELFFNARPFEKQVGKN